MKTIISVLLLICSISCFSQQIERIAVEGEIIVPEGEEREQIVVYNVSSQKGTATNSEGKFKLEVASNDRVLITALQFQSFTVVIDAGVMEKKRMRVYMNPAINQLDEVVVSPYDLSGNILVDVKRTNIYDSPNYDLSYKTIYYDYKFTPDRQSAITGNAAEEALHSSGLQNGFNFVSIFGVVANALFAKKRPTTANETLNSGQVVVTALQQRYNAHYYTDTFGIPPEKVDDFIYFAEEQAVAPYMLRPENEIELLEVLFEQSKRYKARLTDGN